MNFRNPPHRKLSIGKMTLASAAFVLIAAGVTAHAASGDTPRSFSLSTTSTFAPGDSVKIQLFARNVPELEFRVYKVRDAEKFFAGLKDSQTKAINLAIEEINAAGGAAGKKLEADFISYPGTPDSAVDGATRAVQKDGALFLTGGQM